MYNVCQCVYSFNLYCVGCSLHRLSDDKPLPAGVTCDAPMHSLGVSNGIVCYSGIDTGAIALYSCFSCASEIVERSPLVRTCLENGTWNGTIPHCECDGMMSIADSICTN